MSLGGALGTIGADPHVLALISALQASQPAKTPGSTTGPASTGNAVAGNAVPPPNGDTSNYLPDSPTPLPNTNLSYAPGAAPAPSVPVPIHPVPDNIAAGANNVAAGASALGQGMSIANSPPPTGMVPPAAQSAIAQAGQGAISQIAPPAGPPGQSLDLSPPGGLTQTPVGGLSNDSLDPAAAANDLSDPNHPIHEETITGLIKYLHQMGLGPDAIQAEVAKVKTIQDAYMAQAKAGPTAKPIPGVYHINPLAALGVAIAGGVVGTGRGNQGRGVELANNFMAGQQRQLEGKNAQAQSAWQSGEDQRLAGLQAAGLGAQQESGILSGMTERAKEAGDQFIRAKQAEWGYLGKKETADDRLTGVRYTADSHANTALALGQLVHDDRMQGNQSKIIKTLMGVNPGEDRLQAAMDMGLGPDLAKHLSVATPADVAKFAQANNLNDLASDRQATRPYRIANLDTTNSKLGAEVDSIMAGTGLKAAQTQAAIQRVNLYPDEFKARIAKLQAQELTAKAQYAKAQAMGIPMGGRMLKAEADTLAKEASINDATIKQLSASSDSNKTESPTYQNLQTVIARQSQITQRLKEIGQSQSGVPVQPNTDGIWGTVTQAANTAQGAANSQVGPPEVEAQQVRDFIAKNPGANTAQLWSNWQARHPGVPLPK